MNKRDKTASPNTAKYGSHRPKARLIRSFIVRESFRSAVQITPMRASSTTKKYSIIHKLSAEETMPMDVHNQYRSGRSIAFSMQKSENRKKKRTTKKCP